MNSCTPTRRLHYYRDTTVKTDAAGHLIEIQFFDVRCRKTCTEAHLLAYAESDGQHRWTASSDSPGWWLSADRLALPRQRGPRSQQRGIERSNWRRMQPQRKSCRNLACGRCERIAYARLQTIKMAECKLALRQKCQLIFRLTYAAVVRDFGFALAFVFLSRFAANSLATAFWSFSVSTR